MQQKGQLFVIDMEGQIAMRKEIHFGRLSERLSVSQLPSGTYSVEFIPYKNEERKLWTTKVIKLGP